LQWTGFFEVSDEDFNDYTCFGVMPGKEDEGDSWGTEVWRVTSVWTWKYH
jgi:hypothetical protein